MILTLAIVAAAAVVLAVGAIVRWGSLVGVGVGGLALAYAVGLHLLAGGLRAPSAILAGAGLLVVGELGFGWVGRRTAVGGGRRAARGRVGGGAAAGDAPGAVATGGAADRRWRGAGRPAAWLMGCALGGAVVAVVVLAVAAIGPARSLGFTVIGAVATGLVVWLLVRASRAAAPEPRGSKSR